MDECNMFGERIKRLRKEKKVTQQQVACHLNITKQALSKIEKGKVKSINKDYLHGLAQFFRCTEDYLLGRSDDPITKANNLQMAVFRDAQLDVKCELREMIIANMDFVKTCIECDKKLGFGDLNRLHKIMKIFLEKSS